MAKWKKKSTGKRIKSTHSTIHSFKSTHTNTQTYKYTQQVEVIARTCSIRIFLPSVLNLEEKHIPTTYLLGRKQNIHVQWYHRCGGTSDIDDDLHWPDHHHGYQTHTHTSSSFNPLLRGRFVNREEFTDLRTFYEHFAPNVSLFFEFCATATRSLPQRTKKLKRCVSNKMHFFNIHICIRICYQMIQFDGGFWV